ncbi:MAG TPA: flagellar basal body-associated FliL family protein [Alphaproteobacteria bacterium]
MAKDDETDAAPADGEEVKPLDDEEGGKKGLTAKKLLMIVIPVLVLGVAAALYFTGVLDGSKEEGKEGEHVEASAEGGAGGEGGEGGGVPGAIFMEVPDLLVNLSNTGGQGRFLKLKVKLEVGSQEDLTKLESVAPRVVDQFQTFLREMRVQDMRGSAGIYRLRQELLYRVNLAAAPVKVKDVLFQEILIQ